MSKNLETLQTIQQVPDIISGTLDVQFNNNETELSSTNLQDAIQELDTVKAPINSPVFTGTVSGISKSMVGLGSVDNTTDANKPVSTATQTALNGKAPIASPVFTGDLRAERLLAYGNGGMWSNVAVGYNSLAYNTTGVTNTAIGGYALADSTIGSANTTIGFSSSESNIDGANNMSGGYQALQFNVSGSGNTAIGAYALRYKQNGNTNTDLSNCTGLGFETRVGGNNATAIGYNASAPANCVALGTSNERTLVGGAVDNGIDALQVNGSIKADNISKVGSFFIEGELDRFYPVTFNTKTSLYKIQIYRRDVHENALWRGNIALEVWGKASACGHGSSFQNVKYLYNHSNGNTRCAKITSELGCEGGKCIIWLEGGGNNYYFKTDKQFDNPTIDLTQYRTSLDDIMTESKKIQNIMAFDERTLVGGGTDNGVDRLQVNGSIKAERLLAYGSGDNNSNTTVGAESLTHNTIGYYNTALGYGTLRADTTGYSNSAVGYCALVNNTTGTRNVAVGSEAFQYNVSGSWNVAIGEKSLRYRQNGDTNTNFWYCTGLGSETRVGGNNATAIGYNASAPANCVALGTSNERTLVGGAVDNGIDALQVNGSIKANDIFIKSTNHSELVLRRNVDSDGIVLFNRFEMGPSSADSLSFLVLINISSVTTCSRQTATALCLCNKPCGAGLTVVEISKIIGDGISTLTIRNRGDDLEIDTDNDETLICTIKVISIGGMC